MVYKIVTNFLAWPKLTKKRTDFVNRKESRPLSLFSLLPRDLPNTASIRWHMYFFPCGDIYVCAQCTYIHIYSRPKLLLASLNTCF